MLKQAEKELQIAILLHNTRVSEFKGALGNTTDDGYAIDRCDQCQQIKLTVLYTWDSRKPDEGGAECQECRELEKEFRHDEDGYHGHLNEHPDWYCPECCDWYHKGALCWCRQDSLV